MCVLNVIFKGPWIHWIAFIAGLIILSIVGTKALHVREFSLFIFLLLGLSLALVLLVDLSDRR
jgi:hypothetical protein